MAPQVKGGKEQTRTRERFIHVLVYISGFHAEIAFVKSAFEYNSRLKLQGQLTILETLNGIMT